MTAESRATQRFGCGGVVADGGWFVASDVETDRPGYEELFLRPCSGDDATFEVVDGAVGALGLQRGLWMGDDRVMIHLVASVIEQAERFLPYLVGEARAEGTPWEEIARLLGTDVEQARLRFDPASPVADTRWMWDA